MQVNTKEMAGVPVETKSGEHLGKVASFDLDALTGHMQNMHVKTKGIVAGMMSEDIIVSWDAIIEMTLEKVVVRDSIMPVKGTAIADAITGSVAPSSGQVFTRQEPTA